MKFERMIDVVHGMQGRICFLVLQGAPGRIFGRIKDFHADVIEIVEHDSPATSPLYVHAAALLVIGACDEPAAAEEPKSEPPPPSAPEVPQNAPDDPPPPSPSVPQNPPDEHDQGEVGVDDEPADADAPKGAE